MLTLSLQVVLFPLVFYGNSGNDSFVLDGVATSASTYGGAGNDSFTFGGDANTLTL